MKTVNGRTTEYEINEMSFNPSETQYRGGEQLLSNQLHVVGQRELIF